MNPVWILYESCMALELEPVILYGLEPETCMAYMALEPQISSWTVNSESGSMSSQNFSIISFEVKILLFNLL